MKRAVLLTIFMALLSGCAAPPPKQPAQVAAADNWQKIKDCAQDADKVAADYQRRRMPSGAIPGTNWANPYNAKENRCFMDLCYTTIGSAPGSRAARGISVHALDDAFDRKTVAMWADNGCEIEAKKAGCEKVQKFIDEHMKN